MIDEGPDIVRESITGCNSVLMVPTPLQETLKYLKLSFGLPNFTLNWKKIRGQLKNEKNDIVKKHPHVQY